MHDIANDTTLTLKYGQLIREANSVTPPPYSVESFSMYVTRPRSATFSLPLTESGRLWRTLAVAQSVLFFVLFLTLCVL